LQSQTNANAAPDPLEPSLQRHPLASLTLGSRAAGARTW
jgi:hypothetical protein